jgi:hypothetical protein
LLAHSFHATVEYPRHAAVVFGRTDGRFEAIIKMTNAPQDVVSALRDRPASISQDQEVIVTRAMRDAGASVLRDRQEWAAPFFLAEAVYVAMAQIDPSRKNQRGRQDRLADRKEAENAQK